MYGPDHSSPTARTPFRAPLTPTKVRGHASKRSEYFTPPAPSTMAMGRNDYPESPTSPTRAMARSNRVVVDGRISPLPFPLSRPKTNGASWGIPRAWTRPKRIASCLLLLGMVIFVVRMAGWRSEYGGGLRVGQLRFVRWLTYAREEEEPCQFLSPMDAYRRDLERLSTRFPGEYPNGTSTTKSRHRHPHHHHLYSSTGHLLISDALGSPHPIPVLLALGEKRWEELLSRQSRNLGEAVQEYTRRYGRLPPKGFDIWWEYAMSNDLVLPDEYDRINLDLAPFFALPKQEMKRRMRMVENMPETFTLVVRDGEVAIQILDQGGLKWDGTLFRAKDAASLIDSFAQYLPDMRATFSIFDQPQIYLSWARRGSLIDLGLRGETTTHLQETDDAVVRLSRSCAPESNYRRNSSLNEGKSLIYDNLEASDICQNPYLIPLHGLTLEPHNADSHPRPHTQLLPLFSLAKTSINSDILITPLDQFYSGVGRDPKWEKKKSSKLAWRGSSTGMSMMTSHLDWRNSHRIRLHNFANNQSSASRTLLVPDLDKSSAHRMGLTHEAGSSAQRPLSIGDGELQFATETASASETSDFFFDVKLAGEPLQCDEDDGTCQALYEEIEWAPFQRADKLNQHKFLLDIDGNGWSGRFRRLMSTNSVVIKTGIFTEWFQPHLIPWFMYIPSKLDFSDLVDILAFFRGSPKNPDLAFDETARALARNGQCFVKRMFRSQDLEAYMMRLFLEYARLAADDGVDMDFYYDTDEEEDEVDLRSPPKHLHQGDPEGSGAPDAYPAWDEGQDMDHGQGQELWDLVQEDDLNADPAYPDENGLDYDIDQQERRGR